MLETLLMLPLLSGLPASPPALAQAASQETDQTAQDRLDELTDEMDEIITQWRKAAEEARAAAEGGDTSKPMPMRPDFSELSAKFQAAAADYAGTDDAVPFLIWVLQNDGGDGSKAAIATLTESHAGSARIADLGRMLPYLPQICGEAEAKTFFAAVNEQNENVDVIGWVALANLGETIKSANRESDEYKGARTKLLALAEKVENSELSSQLKSQVDLREKFGEGALAPDIEGIDLDGTGFKLSDYGGKVVFLDFWGDW